QRLRRLLGRRSARHEEGAFVVEGALLATEALAAGWELEAQYVPPEGEPLAATAPWHRLGPGVLERVATTHTPQPLPAVFRMPARATAALLGSATFVVVADRLADPGNAGTI